MGKKKIGAKSKYFEFEKDYWLNEVRNAEDKMDAIYSLASHALSALRDSNFDPDPAEALKCLKSINSHAVRVIHASVGCQDGYMLCENWMQCLIAQSFINAANDPEAELKCKGGKKEIINTCKIVFKALDWDYEKAANPTWDSLRTVMYMDYCTAINEDGSKEVSKMKVLLKPVGRYPVGSKYKSANNTWEILSAGNGAYLCEPEEATLNGYTPMSFTEVQIASMERVL